MSSERFDKDIDVVDGKTADMDKDADVEDRKIGNMDRKSYASEIKSDMVRDVDRIPSIGYELVCAIVNYGVASKVLHRAKRLGVGGGTVLHGRGTVRDVISNFFSLYDERKELVLMACSSDVARDSLEVLNKEFKFYKPHRGIVFSTDISDIFGMSSFVSGEGEKEKEVMYQLITTIVDRRKAEDVVDAAVEAGARGGTIINGRGSGIHETKKLFAMNIEPEKEIVLIICDSAITDGIVSSISEKLGIDKAGTGVIFVQDLRNVYGIR